jgi:serine/threonine-protein kinase
VPKADSWYRSPVVPASASKSAGKRSTGQKLGKYTLGEVLGRGGYGEVYAARGKEGTCAIKVLDPIAARDEEVIARFRREAETARRLAHPHIVRVRDVGSSRGRHYLVMDLVRGGSFRRSLDGGTEPATLLAVLAEVASALAYAHAQGIIHRDVKPENVLLTRSRHARIADFGLARAMDASSMTTDGRLLGTAHYMSPEQAKGVRASAASDVYALGVMIYEVICGRRPFDADQTIGLLYQHAEVEPPRPEVRRPFPASLGALALACLAKEPAARPTMAEVAERLAATRLVSPRRRLRIALIATAAIAALLLVLAIVPSILDPLCGDWFGAPVFRTLRRAAHVMHDPVFGSPADHKRAR